MQFKTKSGAQGVLNTFFSVGGYYEDRLLVMGTKGTIEITANQLKLFSEGKKEKVEKWKEDKGYYEEFLDFYNAIIKKKKHDSPAKEAYRDLEVILKGLQAAEQGRKIKL
jgi:predicted dehydrogenase